MSEPIPDVPRAPARASFWERASLVWIVPLGALVIALGVAWNSWAERGPVIRVTFENLSGVVSNETDLRFRDVSVGTVEKISFTPELDAVTAHIRVSPEIAEFIDQDALFWIVRPEVTTSGITGLDTVLSGVYIQGLWDAEINGSKFAFDGLERPPLAALGEDGLIIELRSSHDNGMTENTPILFKGIEVGRIGPAEVSRDGRWVFAEAVIFKPYDSLVTTATRFWDISGFRFSLGAGGAELDFSSVSSLIAGGITFDTLVSGGGRVTEGAVFEVYQDETAAQNSVFDSSDGSSVTLSVIFTENVSGLTAGAPVEWRGVKIGEVTNVNGLIDAERFGDARVRLIATMDVRPSRFGLSNISDEAAFDYLSTRIETDGLRARLASASLLTGGLKVEFVLDPTAAPASLNLDADPFPVMPATENDIEDVAATAEGLFQRVSALPIEDLLQSAIDFLDNATAVVASDELRDVPAELLTLLADARAVVGSEDIQALPADVSAIVEDISAVTTRLSTLLDQVEAQNGIERLLAAVDAAGQAAETLGTASEGVPDLVARLTALTEQVNGLPLDGLVSNASELAAAANAVLSDPATQSLPSSAQDALAEATRLIQSITTENTIRQLNDTLAAARGAAESVETALAGAPEALASVDALASRVAALPLDATLADLADLTEAASAILAAPATVALPQDAQAALQSLQTLLEDARQQGLVEQIGTTLAAASDAARGVETSVEGVPALVERLDSLTATLQELPLDALSSELVDVLDEADRFLADMMAADLPSSLSGALGEVQTALAELREGGLIDSANETLAATERAANAVAEAADDLPGAVDRLSRLLNQASATLSAYSEQSDFNRQTVQTLREVEQAAAAVEALSRALERRPNSIILGR